MVCGIGSEIAQNLAQRLERDGWRVCTSTHDYVPVGHWDLLIFAGATMKPIGKFFDVFFDPWKEAIRTNALLPLELLRQVWQFRNKGAQVVFLGGPNMRKPNETYSAYRCSKALLEAIVPTLNAEYPEHRFHVLHPGVVKTKIHQETIAAGRRAANRYEIESMLDGTLPSVSHDTVYEALKELIE